MGKLPRLAVSSLLASLLLAYVLDWREFLATLRNLDPLWALVAIFIATSDRALMSYKWGLLLAAQGYRLPLLRGFMAYCSSMVWGLALPSTVGADAIRIALVRKFGIGTTDAFISVVVERVIGFVSALLLGVVSLLNINQTLPGGLTHDLVLLAALGLFALACVFWVVSVSPGAFELLRAAVPQRWSSSKVVAVLERLHASYRTLAAQSKTLGVFMGLTLFEQTFAIFFNWSIAIALGIPTTGMWMLAAVPLAILIARLPISFDGIGIYESVFVGVMAMSGMSPAHALPIALAGRILQTIAWLPWWGAEVLAGGTLKPPVDAGESARRGPLRRGEPQGRGPSTMSPESAR
jgi:uncharacterized protein (TIRG00374 family)